MKYSQCNDFSFDAALVLLQSTDPYPVNFDTAVDWLGYKRKDYAKDMLVKNFEQYADYMIEFSGTHRKTPSGGRPSVIVKLTVDCFKTFGMMAATEKGKQIRHYFLECERLLKQATFDTAFASSSSVNFIEHQDAIRIEQRFLAIEDRLERLENEIDRKTTSNSDWLVLPAISELVTTEKLILDFLKRHPSERFSAKKLADALSLPYNSVRSKLTTAYRQGLVRREFNSKHTYQHKNIPKYFYFV